jgi:8-oxo-dGTP pyrophosphatase MutT (NUDIX family)
VKYKNASFPPLGAWDNRLTDIACQSLVPVVTVNENPWFTLRNRGGYFTTEYQFPQVAVLVVINCDSIAMVRVKRPVIDDVTLELPAGGLEKDEDPVNGAARELAEEAGIRISDLSRFVPMPPIATSSTRVPNLSYVFRIDISEQEYDRRVSHDHEIYSVERLQLSDLPDMMNTGQIYVSLSMAVIGTYLLTRQ